MAPACFQNKSILENCSCKGQRAGYAGPLHQNWLEENSLFSWRATDDNEDVFLAALQTAASTPLAPLTRINSRFHLSRRISAPLPGMLRSAPASPPQGTRRIWNNSALSASMLNCDSPGIPPTALAEPKRGCLMRPGCNSRMTLLIKYATVESRCL